MKPPYVGEFPFEHFMQGLQGGTAVIVNVVRVGYGEDRSRQMVVGSAPVETGLRSDTLLGQGVQILLHSSFQPVIPGDARLLTIDLDEQILYPLQLGIPVYIGQDSFRISHKTVPFGI